MLYGKGNYPVETELVLTQVRERTSAGVLSLSSQKGKYSVKGPDSICKVHFNRKEGGLSRYGDGRTEKFSSPFFQGIRNKAIS